MYAVDLNIFQDGGDPDEAVLQREPGGEDRLPEGRRRRHQEAPLVPGQEIIFTLSLLFCFGTAASGFWPDNDLFRVNGLSRTLC